MTDEEPPPEITPVSACAPMARIRRVSGDSGSRSPAFLRRTMPFSASLRATRRCADGDWVRPGSLKWPVPDPSGFGIRRPSFCFRHAVAVTSRLLRHGTGWSTWMRRGAPLNASSELPCRAEFWRIGFALKQQCVSR